MHFQLLCCKISSHTGLHPPFLTQDRFWRWTRTSNVGNVHRNGRPQPTSGHQTMQCTLWTFPPRRDQTWALDTKIVYVSPQMNRTRNEKSWRNAHNGCTIQANEQLKGKNTKARWDKIGFSRLELFCPFDDVSSLLVLLSLENKRTLQMQFYIFNWIFVVDFSYVVVVSAKPPKPSQSLQAKVAFSFDLFRFGSEFSTSLSRFLQLRVAQLSRSVLSHGQLVHRIVQCIPGTYPQTCNQ